MNEQAREAFRSGMEILSLRDVVTTSIVAFATSIHRFGLVEKNARQRAMRGRREHHC
jgi:hypothetical protein